MRYLIILIVFINLYSIDYKFPETLFFAGREIDLKNINTKERLNSLFNLYVYDKRGEINNLLIKEEKFISIAKKELKRANINEDFAYIIPQCSKFDERAYSTNKESGPWQLVENTALLYGLRVDNIVDERNLVEKSSKAAALFISDILKNEYISNNPILALSAFQMGQKNLVYLLKSQKESSFFNIVTSKENSDFVYNVIIYKELLTNYTKYGFIKRESTIDTTYKSYRLSIGKKRLPYNDLCKAIKLSYGEFYIKNPHLNFKSIKEESFFPAYSTLEINVPQNSFTILDSLTNKIKTYSEKSEYNNYLIHTVVENSIGEIAFKYKKNWEDIAKHNNLPIKKIENGLTSAQIYKGQKLKIYR